MGEDKPALTDEEYGEIMDTLRLIIKKFVEQSQHILDNNLVGIYLHGSAVMGCFNDKKSDIDLLVVVNSSLSDKDKLRYMDMVIELNALAPLKGIEFSIVRRNVCKPFIYPTPFELHFSIEHLEWYKSDPYDYILNMNGTDKDLAAHIMIIYHRGLCLYGEEISSVFEEVSQKDYYDSIWYDIEHSEEDIIKNPVYIILNLCRVLAYKQEKLILSKEEGGKWGLANVPEEYCELIQQALDEYASVRTMKPDVKKALEYAKYMIEQIKA